jgi:hypothetical protein
MAKETVKSKRMAERKAYVARVEATIAKAEAAGQQASDEFILTAQKTAAGDVVDLGGNALLTIHSPSYRFREALKSLGQIDTSIQGIWYLYRMQLGVNSRSVQAHEAAARAACEVLRREFPEEEHINYTSRLT